MLFSIFAVYCQMINIKEACSVLIEIYEFLHIHIGIDSSTFMLIYKKEVADLKLESFFDNHIHQIILQEFNLLIKNT
jgi:hypothetical protein